MEVQNLPPQFISLCNYSRDFQNISTLGNGSFGTVVLSKYRHSVTNLLTDNQNSDGTLLDPLVDSALHLNPLVAIKTMKKKLSPIKEYARVKEYKFIISVPSHPSLVQIYKMFIDEAELDLHIVMESMSQNLYSLMKSRHHVKFSSSTETSILRQLADGIRHIHRYGYFHRDIKPENILICATQVYYGNDKKHVPPNKRGDNYIVKIADFGLARHVSNHEKYTAYVSTRWYRSPEILLRRNWYSKPVDIWAFGCVAVEIATFRPLFPGTNELDQVWKVLEVLGCPSRNKIEYPSEIETQVNLHEETDKDSSSSNSLNFDIDDDKTDQPSNNKRFGGYWEEAQVLASSLGFMFPQIDGMSMKQILPHSHHSELGKMVELCLTWNPDKRVCIEDICSISYFANTNLSDPYKEPERIYSDQSDSNHIGGSVDENFDPHNIQNYPGKITKKKNIFPFCVYENLIESNGLSEKKILQAKEETEQRRSESNVKEVDNDAAANKIKVHDEEESDDSYSEDDNSEIAFDQISEKFQLQFMKKLNYTHELYNIDEEISRGNLALGDEFENQDQNATDEFRKFASPSGGHVDDDLLYPKPKKGQIEDYSWETLTKYEAPLLGGSNEIFKIESFDMVDKYGIELKQSVGVREDEEWYMNFNSSLNKVSNAS